MRYDFGQPVSGIMQTAFIVPDIHAAIDHWVSKLVIGPWFLLGEFTGIDPQYRGAPSSSKCAIAMSFAGQMNIEQHGEELSQADESALYHHFELNYTPPDTESGRRLARR